MAATISTAASVGMATVPTTPENASRMIAIQIAGEDRRPAVTCPGRDAQGRLTDRAADGLSPEETGQQVADTLGQEVPVRLRSCAVGVRGGLADARSLDQHERRHGTGARG